MFTLILGPMKSRKSSELLSQMSPYEHTDQQVLYVQPEANVRDIGIRSRMGIGAAALSLQTLNEVNENFDVIGIDEVHMFHEDDQRVIDKWLVEGKSIIASGLDLDYRGKMMPIIIRLLELKPDKLVTNKAVCDSCKKYDARFTQILENGIAIHSGLPHVVPEDGTYEYQARCRDCFVKSE